MLTLTVHKIPSCARFHYLSCYIRAGQIDEAELTALANFLGLAITPSEISAMMYAADENHDG
jgi:Ca2+-binding EF-hand superfamily protein